MDLRVHALRNSPLHDFEDAAHHSLTQASDPDHLACEVLCTLSFTSSRRGSSKAHTSILDSYPFISISRPISVT